MFRGDEPYLAAGAIGAGLHEVMLQNLLSILTGGSNPHHVDRQPKFWGINDKPTALGQYSFFVEQGTFSPEFHKEMLALRQPLELLSPAADSSKRGYWVGIRNNSNELEGSAPKYFNGLAEGR